MYIAHKYCSQNIKKNIKIKGSMYNKNQYPIMFNLQCDPIL